MTSNSSSGNLRPRNRRLISVDNESSSAAEAPFPKNTLASTQSSLFSSRAPSPIPSTHPSRSTSSTRNPQNSQSNGRPVSPFDRGKFQATPAAFATDLWETSWSSLQGIASNLLGSNPTASSKDNPNATLRAPRRIRQQESSHGQNGGKKVTNEWGPAGSADKQVGYGSREERLALVQAKKRETLLAADGHESADSIGKYKRRISEDGGSNSAPPERSQTEQDALVYLHHVQPSDTLAGVAIKYNCQPAVFRKVNRFWPNDNIQIRKTVLLPVEACGVRGRKVPEPIKDVDLLGDENADDLTPTPYTTSPGWGNPTGSSKRQETPFSSIPTSPTISVTHFDDPPWNHDSWVEIDGHPAAVEIARLPRRTLGFFPPSRRKSTTFSDLETPPASLDLPRISQSGYSSPKKPSRSSSGSYFSQQLNGPGGVGTMGREVKSPGPAQDKLNKIFAPHLPNVAPRSSMDSIHSTSSSTGIENVGGAIEGWVRKMATKAVATMQPPPPRERSGASDLIELSDAFEIGGEDADEAADREDSSGGGGGRDRAESAAGTSREDQERLLRERFPPRGKVFETRKGPRRFEDEGLLS